MNGVKPGVRRPASLRQGTAAVAIGVSAAFFAPSLAAQEADQGEIALDTLKIEDRTADVNPYATPGAPYKAARSGDARRVKPLAETPATITVVTETQIEESGRNNFREILDAQPGITVGTGEGGNQFGDRYIIRGQEARSAVYVDGLLDPGLQARESFAVDQIEVTKGPSATFAGRGASGGAVNAISKQATTDYNFHNVDLTAGTESHVRATIDSNLRLSDNLALRANLLYTNEDVPDRDPARRKRFGAALAIKADVSEKVSVLADYYHVTVRDRADLGQAIANLDNGGKPFSDIPPYAQREDFQNAKVNILTGRIRIEAWEGFRIENAARYGRTTGNYIASQVSRFTRGANDPTAPGAVDYRISNTRTGWQDIDYFADRLNLVGEFMTGGVKHNLVAGVEYSTYNVDGRSGTAGGGYSFTSSGGFNCINGSGTALNAWCVTDGAGNLLDNYTNLVQRTGITRNTQPSLRWQVDTLAGYLMDSIDITNWLTIAGGLRFDAYDYRLRSYNTTTGVLTQDYNSSDTIWSYNASIALKPNEEGIVYFAWATGADVNGGESDVGTNCGYGGLCTVTDPDTGSVVYQGEPERSDNLELGTKWELFDDRLLLTAALFQTVKKNIFEGGSNSYVATGSLNSGKLRVRGVELGLAGNITDQLSGQVSVSLMKSKVLKSIDNNFNAQQIAAGLTNVGKRISNFANNSVDAQLRYQITERLAIGGTATYQSAMYAGQPDSAATLNTADLDSSPTVLVPGPNFGKPNIRIPDYTTFGAFVSFKVNENLSLRLNGLNLTDKRYYTAAYRSGGFAYLGDGRTVRLTLSGKF
ncbi:TonB-dependent receptor [Parapedomonas caeni]